MMKDAFAAFQRMAGTHRLSFPFAAELKHLQAINPQHLLEHERHRMADLERGQYQIDALQKPFSQATEGGDWPSATRIAQAAFEKMKPLAVMVLMMLALAAKPARAQGLPYQIPDPPIMEDLDYLDSRFRQLLLEFTTISSGSALTGNITLQGNAFNAASQLVQLDSSARLPAVSGALLTGITESQVTNLVGDLAAKANAGANADINSMSALQSISSSYTVTSSVTITNVPNGLGVPRSSVTASAFFGDGSHLTGLPSSSSIVGIYVLRAGDSMTGGLSVSSTVGAQYGFVTYGLGTGSAIGNARGSGAADLQVDRVSAVQVASGIDSVIAGGQNNEASANYATVGGGSSNGATALNAVIAGGGSNGATGTYSFVGGGATNSASQSTALVVGGSNNTASGTGAAVLGGAGHTASGTQSAIGGGNSNTASGLESTVPGGINNTASGDFSMAAGRQAKATAQGSFAWADSQAVDFTASIVDQFKIRSQGGFYIDASSSSFGQGAKRSTFSVTGDLAVPSSVTASAFFGDGSHLTGISALSGGANTYYAKWTGASSLSTGYISEVSSGVTISSNVAVPSSSVTASAFFGDGSHLTGIAGQAYTTISTVNAQGAGSIFAQRSTVAYDSTYFTIVDSGTNNASVVSLKQTVGVGQTRQIFTGGSGTYTTPIGCNLIRVRACGGGGGGGGVATGPAMSGTATSGGNTSFNSIVASGGSNASNSDWSGGAGGTGGSGTASVRSPGNPGGLGTSNSFNNQLQGGWGGGTVLAGGGAMVATRTGASGNAGATNTGGGGSGANTTSGTGGQAGGGGGGECYELLISSPAASYAYSVGPGGNGAIGTQFSGGNGSTGTIIVDEFYPPIAAVAGTLAYYVDPLLSQANGVTKAFSLSQNPNPQSLMVFLDGILQSSASDYSLSGAVVTMTTAPAANSSSFLAQYAVNTSTLPQAMLVNSSDTVNGAKNFVSSVTVDATKVRGISGGIVASASVSAAASTLISGLDGNTDKNWRIQIDGLIAASGSNSFVKLRPNSDSGANYQGIQNSDYSGATTRNAWSAGLYAGELLSNTAESIHATFWLHASAATNLKRCGALMAGFSDTGGEQGETHGGGCWTNTTDNITSLNIIWANTSFTGTVTIYLD